MQPGARLVVVLPNIPRDGQHGFAKMINDANAVLQEMVDEGAITADEREQMVIGVYPRSKDELFAPFAAQGRFQGLAIEDYQVLTLPDAVWAEYESNGDSDAMARTNALFFRTVFSPSLATALTSLRHGNAEALESFADRLQHGLTRRLTIAPVPMDMLVQVIVFEKCG
jgi:hypothetical protein